MRLEEEFPDRFTFEPDRDAFDYLYSVEKLAELSGKKLHAKRNHINRFCENLPDWEFEPLTADNRTECRAMEEAWLSAKLNRVEGERQSQLLREHDAVCDGLEHLEKLGLSGGLIRAGGRVVAFSLGSRLGRDVYDVHFEKAFDDIQGAYSAINREMARYVRKRYPEVVWIDREDDMGLEGLRKAKLSYHPSRLAEKFTVTERIEQEGTPC